MTLVARRREHFRVFLPTLLVAQLSSKRGVLVHKNSLASCQRCRRSVEPRALTCPFKHSDLIAWSLLSWHLTHQYLWERLLFLKWHCWMQGRYFFVTKTLGKRLCTRYCWRNMVCRRSGWSSWTGDRTLTWLWLQHEKVDFRLRTVTVSEVLEEAQRNGAQTKKNRNMFSFCDNYVTGVDVRCF